MLSAPIRPWLLATLAPLFCHCSDEPLDAPMSATLVVTDPGPVSGIPVLFHDTDGHILSETTTDGDGVARGPMVAGGMVTFAVADPASPEDDGVVRLHTYTGVEPGDELSYQARTFREPTPFLVRALSAPPYAGASEYTLSLGCRSFDGDLFGGATDSMSGETRCLTENGGLDAILQVRGPAPSENYDAYAILKDVPIVDGEVALEFDAWETNYSEGELELREPADGDLRFTAMLGAFVDGDGAERVAGGEQVRWPTNYYDRVTYQWLAMSEDTTSRVEVLELELPPVRSRTMYPASDMPARLVDVQVSGDLARPTLSFQWTDAPDEYDGGIACLAWDSDGPHNNWRFYVSDPAAPLTAPVLSESLAAFGPQGDSFDISTVFGGFASHDRRGMRQDVGLYRPEDRLFPAEYEDLGRNVFTNFKPPGGTAACGF